MAWGHPLEHLTLAAIAFPLLVRCRLRAAGVYHLTRADLAAIEAFEAFADQPGFLENPPNWRGAVDSWWARMMDDAKWRL